MTWATVACGEPTAPFVQPTLDDALFHVQLAGPLSAAGSTELGSPLVNDRVRRGPDCPFDDSARRFVCAASSSDGLTLTRSYELLDASNRSMPAWNDDVVAIRLVNEVAGRFAARDEATLTGLRSGQQRLTGVATVEWTNGDGASWHLRRTTDMVILSRVIMPGIFPTGSIELSATRADSPESRLVSLTYDGTSKVSMLANFGGGASLACTFDLLKPDAPRTCG